MSSLSNNLCLTSCAVALISGLACSAQNWSSTAHQTNADSPDDQARPASSIDRDRELHLFGQGAPARDVTFEGQAATNLLQHTSISEGVDFDPDVDPTGKLLVFASTRHSPHSHLYSKPIGGAVITQITDDQANDAQPAFSQSGKRIAFTSNRSGHWDIWVVDSDGRNPIQISNNPAAELHPSWSPDDKSLVYCRINPEDSRGQLWVVDLENPGVKRLIGEGIFPEWSPKGDKIAYQRSRARGSRWFSIWTLDINENEVLFPTEVASRPDAALISPTWSPDASQIAFTSVIPAPGSSMPRLTGFGRADIGIVDADGRGMQRLTNGRGGHYSPSWAIDGRIYFTAKSSNAETIWSVSIFRPAILPEPETTTADRRAAAVSDTDPEE